MIIIKNKLAIDKMRIAGHRLAKILKDVSLFVKPGVDTATIDSFIEQNMKKADLKTMCKGYRGYCHATCISINDEIVHGVPSQKVVLKSGDFVKIDVVGSYQDYCADITRFYFVDSVGAEVQCLAQTAQRALDKAIEISRPGIHLSDLSSAIQKVVEEAGFNVVRDFAGHGIGKNLHEPPDIPNYGEGGKGPILRSGMTLAIEPMITQGHWAIKIDKDGWTARTADGKLSAHVEDTIAITSDGAEVLTRL
ncbi:MAG: type I methionyl aminopeptidase [bacterium]